MIQHERTIRVILALLLAVPLAARSEAQWQLLDPPTTADLRGIDNVGGGVAWASGTNGTVVRTEDGGYMWQHCSIPPGAEKLDFRGIQAFDENTAIVMSSGPGDQSRLYKTTDGCQTWKLLFTNPDPTGFFDAITASRFGATVLGDPVNRQFAIFKSQNDLREWHRLSEQKQSVSPQMPDAHSSEEGLFAASNSNLLTEGVDGLIFITGGKNGSFIYFTKWHWILDLARWQTADSEKLPMAKGESAGPFSLAARHDCPHSANGFCAFVVVGGDYKKTDDTSGTAAYAAATTDRQMPSAFRPSQTPPHGYRSSVAYDQEYKTWITVGPNGTDISTDDGRTWSPLRPSAQEHDAPDADQHWNALSLPFVVGPHGRIGKLRGDALNSPATPAAQAPKAPAAKSPQP
jgi:hypothetical protein